MNTAGLLLFLNLLAVSAAAGGGQAVGSCEQASNGACAAQANATAPQPPAQPPAADLCVHQQDAAGPGAPQIAVGFTTARRPAYFKRTYHSFQLRCLDCDSWISDMYAVDDGSTLEELAVMQRVAPQIKWINKTEAGHVGSINAMMAVAAAYDYFVWMEDDWYFVRDEDLITKALSILRAAPDVAQVLFNRNFAHTDNEAERELYAVDELQSACGTDFIKHKYCMLPNSSSNVSCLANVRRGQSHHFFWPHFSLRPGVWRMSHMLKMGPMKSQDGFERQHGFKFLEQGFTTAFLPEVYAIHIGIDVLGMRYGHPELQQFVDEAFARHHISSKGMQHSAYGLRRTTR